MKIDATTILLVGGGILAVYLLTRPTTPTPQQLPVYNPYPTGYNPAAQANPTAQDISAGGTAVSQILNSLSSGGVI
jgi:hypothetical protein